MSEIERICDEPTARQAGAPGTMAGRRSTRAQAGMGRRGIGNYFYWKAAHRKVWRNTLPGIASFRVRKAERLG